MTRIVPKQPKTKRVRLRALSRGRAIVARVLPGRRASEARIRRAMHDLTMNGLADEVDRLLGQSR
jgi:hypothetical protein